MFALGAAFVLAAGLFIFIGVPVLAEVNHWGTQPTPAMSVPSAPPTASSVTAWSSDGGASLLDSAAQELAVRRSPSADPQTVCPILQDDGRRLHALEVIPDVRLQQMRLDLEGYLSHGAELCLRGLQGSEPGLVSEGYSQFDAAAETVNAMSAAVSSS